MTYWFARIDPSKANSAFAPVAPVGWFVTFALAAALARFVVVVMDAGGSPLMQILGIAAGVLIVQEAGGVATHHRGGPIDLADSTVVSAATRPLHDELQLTIEN